MTVDEFDRRVDKLVDRIRGNRTLDRVFYGASAIGDHGMLWVMLGAGAGVLGHKRQATRVILGAGAESIIVNGGVKLLFRRSRPVVDEPRPLPLRIPLTSSFPSGHASSAFFAATLLSEGSSLGPLYFGAAAIVAASRLYVKIHHASDVLGGVTTGLILGQIARRVYPLESPATRKG